MIVIQGPLFAEYRTHRREAFKRGMCKQCGNKRRVVYTYDDSETFCNQICWRKFYKIEED